VLFQLVGNVLDVSTEDAWLVNALPVLDVEGCLKPESLDFLSESSLKL